MRYRGRERGSTEEGFITADCAYMLHVPAWRRLTTIYGLLRFTYSSPDCRIKSLAAYGGGEPDVIWDLVSRRS